jgi:aminopeptidase N
MTIGNKLIPAFRELLSTADLDKAMLARLLTMPSEAYLGELSEQIDVVAIHTARHFVRRQIVSELHEELLACYRENHSDNDYQYQADAVAQRSLKNVCLQYLMLLNTPQVLDSCLSQYHSSSNMTDVSAALAAIVHSGFSTEKENVLVDFYQRWQHDPLVVDQWLAVQSSSPQPESFKQVQMLLQHPAFDISNPNKVRSVIGVFCNQNAINFHRPDGSGYTFLADKIIELDKLNPQIAARLVTPLTTWRHYVDACGSKMQAELKRIEAHSDLSKDVFEIVSKSLQ